MSLALRASPSLSTAYFRIAMLCVAVSPTPAVEARSYMMARRFASYTHDVPWQLPGIPPGCRPTHSHSRKLSRKQPFLQAFA